MLVDLDALDNFIDSKDEEIQQGTLSIRVPIEDMTVILTQMWKSRRTEPKMGELYEKYKSLIPSK
jgi:TPP-dependent pyruvate/acetoin dehydrogenase alpha subunit